MPLIHLSKFFIIALYEDISTPLCAAAFVVLPVLAMKVANVGLVFTSSAQEKERGQNRNG